MSKKTLTALFVTFLLTPSAAPELRGQEDAFGRWTRLFNGKDNSEWSYTTYENRKKKIGWSVEAGALTNGTDLDGFHDICSFLEFDNYELSLKYRIARGGATGIYLRGKVRIQIADSEGKADNELTVDHVAGIPPEFVPLMNTQKQASDWNSLRVRHIGHRVTVWHNDVLVQDNVHVDSAAQGCMGEDHPATGSKLDGTKGPLMLKSSDSQIWYRDILVRPFCSGDRWRPLWNGVDVSQFRGQDDSVHVDKYWSVVDNALTNRGHAGNDGRDIWTRDSFDDFLLHYEYRVNPSVRGGDGGIFLRDQWELQIHSQQSLEVDNLDGAFFSKRRIARTGRNRPTQWNHMEVKVAGMRIWVWQNGVLLHDGVKIDTRTDNHRIPTKTRTKEPLRFQGTRGEVHFANLWVKSLEW